ncbi:MAG: isochorismate synthase [Tannerella sp.]|jgi:isochorismate synthase|nr:isochorismate synthase [Tannerella sp.]
MDYLIFDRLINSKLPFALYKLPGEGEVCMIMQETRSVQSIRNIENVVDYKGFIISPFIQDEQTPTVIIRPDFYIKGLSTIIDFLENRLPQQQEPVSSHEREVIFKEDFKAYAKNFEIFHKTLMNKQFDKLVLSRILSVEKEQGFSIGQIFERAIETYPDAFTYLLNTSETGVWMGCTPELLLSEKNGEWRTAAVAGTRKTAVSPADWDRKNIEEQEIVVKFIEEQLKKTTTDFVKGSSQTVTVGNIEHYKTDFKFHLDFMKTAGLLIRDLHPTPAVCGLPRNEAMEFIAATENHPRLYYSGFIGPVNMENAVDLHVNIRCMHVSDCYLNLYVGGGLIAGSILDEEWLETEYKLQMLLRLF